MSPGGGGSDNSAVAQLLLKFGLDLTPIKSAAGAIKVALEELNKMADETVKKSKTGITASKKELETLKLAAQAAVMLNKQALDQEKLKSAQLKNQTDELKRQSQEVRNATLEEQKRKAILQAETEELRKQAAAVRLKKQEEAAGRRTAAEPAGGGESAAEAVGIGGAIGLAVKQFLPKLLARLGMARAGAAIGAAGGGPWGAIAGGALAFFAGEAAWKGVTKLWNALKGSVETSGDLLDAWRQFESLSAGVGRSAEADMQEMRKATEGMVDDMTLLNLQTTNLRDRLPVTVERLREMAAALVSIAEARGQDPGAVIRQFERALATGEFTRLGRQLGIDPKRFTADIDPALSSHQQKMEKLTEVYRVFTEEAKSTEGSFNSLSDTLRKMKVWWDNLINSISMWIQKQMIAQKLMGKVTGKEEPGPVQPYVPPVPPESEQEKAARIERLKMVDEYRKEVRERNIAGVREFMQAHEAELTELMRLDKEAYSRGETLLKDYLKTQERLTKEAVSTRDIIESEAHSAILLDLNTKIRTAMKEMETKTPGIERERIGAQIRSLTQQVLAEESTYRQKKINARKELAVALAKLEETDREERKRKRLDEIEEERQDLENANQDAVALNERRYERLAVSADEYFDDARRLVRQRAQDEINAAEAAVAAHTRIYGIESIEMRKEANRKIKAAQLQLERDLTDISVDEGRKRMDLIERIYASQTSRARSALDRIRGADPGAVAKSELSAIENVIKALEREKQVKDDLLGAGTTSIEQTNTILEQMKDLADQIGRLRLEAERLKQIMPNIAAAFDHIGRGISTVFTSRFAQNLGSQVQAGAGLLGRAGSITEILAKQAPEGAKPAEKMKLFAEKLGAAVDAIGSFVNSLTNAQSAISGGVGGAMAGAGLGQVAGGLAGQIFKGLGAAGGPIGAAVGAVLGGVMGAITGAKNAAVKRNIDDLNRQIKDVTDALKENGNNLQLAINDMRSVVAEARAMQAASKKGSGEYQKVIDAANDQLHQLELQQMETIRNLRQQLEILRAPEGMRDFLGTLKDIMEQYNQFAGAAANAEQLALANEWLTLSLQDYSESLSENFADATMDAINDALRLNDLLYQREQLLDQINEQVRSVLSQGVLVRTPTRAQSAGEQIARIREQSERQLSRLNMEIQATQHRVNSEQQIFNMATTRIGLETQLLELQKAQTDEDMARIRALQQLLTQIQQVGPNNPYTQALLGTLQPVTNPLDRGSNSSNYREKMLAQLFGAAYESRSEYGYGDFRGQNL